MKIIFLSLFISLQLFAQKPLLDLFDGVSHTAATTEYKRLIDSVGGVITEADLTAIDVFVNETSTIRSKIVRFNPFAGSNLTTALVPLFRGDALGNVYGSATDLNTNFVSGDYTRAGGLGNTSNTDKYLKTGIIPNDIALFGLNSASIGFWWLSNKDGAFANGVTDGTSAIRHFPRLTDVVTFYINKSPVLTGLASTNCIGFWLGSRISATTVNFYKNADSVLAQAQSTDGKPTKEIYIMGYNNNGTAAWFEQHISTGYIIGAGLTTAEVVILYNAWNKLKTAFGR